MSRSGRSGVEAGSTRDRGRVVGRGQSLWGRGTPAPLDSVAQSMALTRPVAATAAWYLWLGSGVLPELPLLPQPPWWAEGAEAVGGRSGGEDVAGARKQLWLWP